MMVAPVSQYLPTFAGEPPQPAPRERLKPICAPPKRREEEIAEAEERGRRAGEAAARSEFERMRAEDRAAHEARLQEERRVWVEETAARLAAGLAEGIQRVEARLADSLARALVPLLGAAIQRRAMDEMCQALDLLGEDGVKVRMSGPADLVEALRRRLKDGAEIDFSVSDSPDLTVVIGDTRIETRIAAWIERLSTALAGDRHG